MIIVNGAPKSGTTMLVTYLQTCGLILEPGGLMAYPGDKPLVMRGGKPWGDVRSLDEVLDHFDKDRVVGAHVGDHVEFPGHLVVFTYRNPRDMVVSQARWRAVGLDWTNVKEQPSESEVRAHITNGLIREVLTTMRSFEGWLLKADATVEFSEFVKKPHLTAARLGTALHMSMADPEDMLGDKAPWVTEEYRGTWSGQHSDWRQVWDQRLDEVWTAWGGLDVERAYGFNQ